MRRAVLLLTLFVLLGGIVFLSATCTRKENVAMTDFEKREYRRIQSHA